MLLNLLKMKTKTKIPKQNPIKLIKKVELIYDKNWDSFMVKINISGHTIFYPVTFKQNENGNNLRNR